MIAEGCIHGRFQPFHNENLEDAFEALERCQFLWFGLGDPFPAALIDDQPLHDGTPSSTPLTYHERQFMITRVLVAEGIPPERFSFTPFPITMPDFLPNYLDVETTCFVAGGDEWALREAAALHRLGYPLETLRSTESRISGTQVRSLLRADDPAWRDLVPTSVANYLEELDLATRLRNDDR